MQSRQDEFLVDLYFDCRDSKIYPHPGSMVDQTAYTIELFKYLDDLSSEYISREAKKAQDVEKKQFAEIQNKRNAGGRTK